MGLLLSDLRLIEPRRFGDSRGWFSESYSERDFAARGICTRFVQDNHSLSREAFTLRGLHWQAGFDAQAKLVRCVSGRMFDVAVDLRADSPDFGRWCGVELSADNGRQLYVPTGFAHGFLTLEPLTEVVYKVSAAYAPASERGLRWDDPHVAIDWPLPADVTPLLSDKDAVLPLLAVAFPALAVAA